MYLTTPCNETNSLSPISPRAIASQLSLLTTVDQDMTSGNNALNDLITALGGNSAGVAVPGTAGVPTGNLPVIVSDPAGTMASNPYAARVWGPGKRLAWVPRADNSTRRFPVYGRDQGYLPVRNFDPCGLPQVLPVSTEIAVPASASVSTVPLPPSLPPLPRPQTAAPAPLAECDVNADTICMAIRSGCVLQSQVSPAQAWACSQAGYAGNTNQYPQLAARGGAQGGKFFGSLNLKPAPYSPGMGDDPAMVAGMPSNGQSLLWLAGAAAVVWFVSRKVR